MNNLTNAFHTVAAFFSGQAPGSTDMPFTFEAEQWIDSSFSGYSDYEVPGLKKGALDFFPSGVVSSFLRGYAEEKFWEADLIGGGFSDTKLSLLCGYGTGVRLVPDQEIDALINAANMQIDELLLAPPHYLFRRALKDRYVFRVISLALQDGIKFFAIDQPNLTEFGLPNAVGNYVREVRQIRIATKLDQDEVIDTIQHELLHYAFDKSSNMLGNVEYGNPPLSAKKIREDHFVLEVVMEKLQTQSLCKKGLIKHLNQPSWGADIYGFNTIFNYPFSTNISESGTNSIKFNLDTIGGTDFSSFQNRFHLAWNNNEHNDFMSVLDDPDFASAAVAAQLIPILPQPLFSELKSIPLLFTAEMYQDMAFLHAQRYAMYVHGIYELSLISKRNGVKMKDLFVSEDADDGATLRNFGWHTRMDAFFTEFFEALITDPMEGVLTIEGRLRKP